MHIFSILKNIFSKKEVSKEEYSVVVRRGYEIILPRSFYNTCKEKDYSLSIVINKKNKQTSVQVSQVKEGKRIYVGTVKKMLNISKFKDKNVWNFSKENIIEKEIENGKK